MAFEICRALIQRGISVALVSGPCTQSFETLKLAKWKKVETAEEMNTAVQSLCKTFRPTHAIFSAAVLDFTPTARAKGKVSSARKEWTVKLKPTPKIVDEVGRRFPKIARVGFKLEAERKKTSLGTTLVRRKGYRALILNYLSEIGAKSHPTELHLPDGGVIRSSTKREAARTLVRMLPQLGKDTLAP